MTANDVLRQSMAFLGYGDNDGNAQLSQRVTSRAVPIFNLVYNDLRNVCGLNRQPINSLIDEFELPEQALDVLTCGVASYLAAAEGDDTQQYLWSNEYQQRRASLSMVSEIEDVIPSIE
jgi:hypothetical protein